MKQFDAPALLPAEPQANTTNLLLARLRATPDRPLFAIPSGDSWQQITVAEFHQRVVSLAKGFVAAGIEPGDKIGIMCRTRYEWSLIDFACWFAGAILVPIYDTSSPTQIHWNMTDSGAVAIVLETAEMFARFDEVRADLPLIHNVWQIDLDDLDKLSQGGSDVSDAEIERRRGLATEDDIATLIYTSGSTGKPKGCVLTHKNFVELSRNAAEALSEVILEPGASTLLFITMAHVFARFISVMSISSGVLVGHQPDTSKLLPALASFKPSFLLAVPRVFEKVYNSAEQKAEATGKGAIFRAAVACAIEHSQAVQRGKVPLGLRLKFAFYDRLVLQRLRAAMGGKVRYAVSGSAPLGPRLGHFFHSLGIKILEGYGLTETTAPATVNRPEQFKIGTVGTVIPGVSVRISDESEIQVKGINVFDRYWNDDDATQAAFDDGWFKTGDLGDFDEEGFLSVTGRIKEIIVTAGGKNVSPAALEDPIRANPLIGQVIAVGDQRPFIAALITLDPEMLPAWLANHDLSPDLTIAQAAENPAVQAEVQRAIDAANHHVSRAESIRKFLILTSELTEASGHITPKLSIKRNVILKDFATVIDEMYSGDEKTQGISLSH